MTDRHLSLKSLEWMRARRWRTAPARQIASERGALRFISELGFVLLMPISGADFPSISAATSTQWSWWKWKQTLPEKKACYYAKVLRRRGTFIAWEWFPLFYAAYADPRPYARQYRDGGMDRGEKKILDLLDACGPLMTREIRLAFGPSGKENTRRVKSILTDLQTRFLITAAGGDTEGWSHHRWDLVERWVPPHLLATARGISQQDARAGLITRFVENVIAATPADVAWMLGWERSLVNALIADLMSHRKIGDAAAPELAGNVLVPANCPLGRRPRGRPSP